MVKYSGLATTSKVKPLTVEDPRDIFLASLEYSDKCGPSSTNQRRFHRFPAALYSHASNGSALQ